MAIEKKITTAVFEPGSTTANVYGLWQYDYGQVLRIQGLHLPSMVEIHFSLQVRKLRPNMARLSSN